MIGKLLGHTQVATTARYAHLAADPVKAAAEQVSGDIARAVLGEESMKTAAAATGRENTGVGLQHIASQLAGRPRMSIGSRSP
jgi:hypothetical protein